MTSPEPELQPTSRRFSIEGQLAAGIVLCLLVFGGLVAVGLRFGIPPWDVKLPLWIVLLLAFAVALVLALWIVARAVRPLRVVLGGLSDGIRSFRDRDFGVRLASARNDELGDLARLYNVVGEILQDERHQIRQRELLLQTALDHSPLAIVLVNPIDRVVYANHEARRLFMGGGKLEGNRFGEILAGCPDEMRRVLDNEADGLFSVLAGDDVETYHLARRDFFLNRFRHTLYLVRRMTAELTRQEAEIWKKVIRIISHELNNSLAPISSLAHSALLVSRRPDKLDRLEPIYTSIRERIDHLTGFLEGYARFARLPNPVKRSVDWYEWLAGPRKLYDFELLGDVPSAPGYFDPSQLEQVLINLLKNAVEASQVTDATAGEAPRLAAAKIAVRIERQPAGATRVQVLDRGRGMDEEVMRSALLPFYSTKQSGGGVGLPLCREIVEAHGGLLRIQTRPGGGTVVSFWLPGRAGVEAAPRAAHGEDGADVDR